jgi:glycosyltransferase involved in cell wall biosynthesis
MKPLVSILIPAYNAERWIAEAIQSAVAQTWPQKEIIVVNDGSTDRTAEIAQRFASKHLAVLSTENRGLSAAVNHGYRQCQGDFIQELDADDLLVPDKIERQLAAVRERDSRRILLSCSWAPFFHRTRRARFIRTSLCQDLSPVEWLLRAMGENLHMQNATWLVSRELTEAAGPWDESLRHDQDGEYFARVLVASERTRFVSETGVFYRASPSNRVSYLGNSNVKKDSLFRSMKLHIQYLRSLEESERVRKACVSYLQNWYPHFYAHRPDIMTELQAMAAELGGHLAVPSLNWKYAWIAPVLGRKTARWLQSNLPEFKSSLLRQYDRAMFKLEGGRVAGNTPA